jgi:zinc protease
MKYISLSAAVLLSIFCSTILIAQEIPLDPKVKTGKLANGFTYYLRKNNEPKKSAVLYLVNNVGSVLEDGDQQGLAHFMEHMNFNGTKNYPKNALVDYLQKAGISFGSDLNAHTGLDETIYELPIPTDDKNMINHGISIMRDWAQEATLDANEIEKERGVILEEGRLAKGSSDRMSRKYLPMLLNNTIYAKRLPIGQESVLKNFQRPAIKRFFDTWYRPDLQALIIVGDIDVAEVEQHIKTVFADLKMPEKPRYRETYPIPLIEKKQFMAVTDKEMAGARFEVLFKHKAKSLTTQADYLELMKRSLLGYLINTRRYAEISRQREPAYSNMSLGIQPFMGGIDQFDINIEVKGDFFEKSFSQAWTIFERIRRYGFKEEELKEAKLAYLKTFETGLQEKDKTASLNYVTEYKNLYLHKEAAPGIEWETAFVKNNIDRIGPAEISALLNEYLDNLNIDVIVLASDSQKAILPDSATTFKWIEDFKKAPLDQFISEKKGLVLLDKQPTAGRVISKKSIPELGLTTLTLSNGIKVVLKPTDFKNDQIIFRGFRTGGTSIYDDADFDNASNAAALISRFGLGKLNPIQLNQALNGKNINVSTAINQRSETVNGASSIEDIETALQVVYLQFSQPRKDSLIFVNTINSTKEMIRARGADPASVFADTISRVLGNYSYRSAPLTPERLTKLSLDKMYQIYTERFSNASGFTFVFTGSINQETLIPLLEKYIGGLSVGVKSKKARDLGIHIPEGKIEKTVHKGTEDKASVRLILSGNYQYAPVTNLQFKALSDILQFKLLENLRESQGEVYSPSVQLSYVKQPNQRYALILAFGCAPKNVEHLINQANKEIQELLKGNILESDISKFKTAYSKNVELALKDNGFWLNYLSGQLENEEDLFEASHHQEYLNRVTKENLTKAAQIIFQDKNLIRFVLLPEGE